MSHTLRTDGASYASDMKRAIRRRHLNPFVFLTSFPSAPASASVSTSACALTYCRRVLHHSCHHRRPSSSTSVSSTYIIKNNSYNRYYSQFTPRSFSTATMINNPPASPQLPTAPSLNSKPSVTTSQPPAERSPSTATSTPLNEQWLPHRLDPLVPIIGAGNDWISPLYDSLKAARDFRPQSATRTHPPRILVLYGTLRPGGFSKLLAYECARLCETLDLDVRVFNPSGLPVRDPELQEDEKVIELRSLVEWSEGHVWVGSELHGSLCSVFKNQIDWIPLNSGSIRPTQGKCCAVLQVCGGSQSFNVVNSLRLLARWMRMHCVVNQSAVPMAWKQFNDDGRMKEGSLRERVVDVMEEFGKTVRINREYADFLTDRYSERKEKEEKGRLLTQAEKESVKDKIKKNLNSSPTTDANGIKSADANASSTRTK